MIGLRRALVAAFVVGLAVSITLAETALVLLAAHLAWETWRRRAWPAPWPLIGPLGAFAAASLLAALASARPGESALASRTLGPLAAFYVVLFALPGAEAARRLLALLAALVWAVAALSLVQVAACPAEPPPLPVIGRLLRKCDRARGFYSIYMTLAGVLTLVLLATSPAPLARARGRWWPVAAWVTDALALVYTYVRGAWIGLGAGLLVDALLLRRRLWLVVGGAALALAVAAAVSPTVRVRVLDVVNPRTDTAIDRIAMLGAGLRMVRDHPLTGVGPGQVKHLYPAYARPEARRHATSHLHNTPLQILVERGPLGLAAWLALFAMFFLRAIGIWRAIDPRQEGERALVAGSIAATAGFLVSGLFEYNFGDAEVLLVACSLMALPFVVERGARATAPPGGAQPAPGPP